MHGHTACGVHFDDLLLDGEADQALTSINVSQKVPVLRYRDSQRISPGGHLRFFLRYASVGHPGLALSDRTLMRLNVINHDCPNSYHEPGQGHR